MRLLGVMEKGERELFLIEDNGNFYVRDASEEGERFSNYEVIKSRDVAIGNEEKNGEGVFNFRYGPITAGVRECGVFNIKTYGERILSVSIDPSYKKRNIESLMIGSRPQDALKASEGVCGNFAFSHSLAFCRAIENASSLKVKKSAKVVRLVALELERIYNHLHVIFSLSKAAAQNVLSSHLGWLFEEALRINGLFSSDRFLKGINRIGGVSFVNHANLGEVKERLQVLKEKFRELYDHSLRSWNFIDRIYRTAPVDREKAYALGLTGPSLRAAGIADDLRVYDEMYADLKVCSQQDGDALARMQVRACEILSSCDLVINAVDKIGGNMNEESEVGDLSSCGIGAAESPAGMVVYYVELKGGVIDYVYISTPSIFGYKAFADSVVGFIFTDFSFALDSFGVNFADCGR